MLVLFVNLHVVALLAAASTEAALTRLRAERGQTSAEYALVLLGAASVALLVALWAKKSDSVGGLLDSVFGNLVDMVK